MALVELEYKPEEDTREPWEKIWLEAKGGTDVCGEWHWNGSYDISIPSGKIGNAYKYRGGLDRPWSSKAKKPTRWLVTLSVCGGEYDRQSLQILRKTTSSKKKALQLVADTIFEFEKTDRFKEELWPQIIHPDKREPILKEIDGELIWIATTWIGTWSALQGKSSWMGYTERPFGSGKYYTREVQYEMKYPKTEDGKWDWDRGEKIYKDPSYQQYEISYYGMSGGGRLDPELKEKIDAAIWNTNDLIFNYIAIQNHARATALSKGR